MKPQVWGSLARKPLFNDVFHLFISRYSQKHGENGHREQDLESFWLCRAWHWHTDELRASTPCPRGLCKRSLSCVPQAPRVPRDGLSHIQRVAALHPPILTTVLLERGEEGAPARQEPSASLGTRALHNVHLFWVLT